MVYCSTGLFLLMITRNWGRGVIEEGMGIVIVGGRSAAAFVDSLFSCGGDAFESRKRNLGRGNQAVMNPIRIVCMGALEAVKRERE